MKEGVLIEGELTLPERSDTPLRGFYIECAEGSGTAILIDAASRAELGSINRDGTGFKAEKRVDRDRDFPSPARFRLLLKHSLLEFYLDGILIECFSLPGKATGRIGVIQGGRSNAITNLKAWQCTDRVLPP